MATYNNPHWLLSHIRNSFISTDDTGVCELVMLSEDLPSQLLTRLQSENNEDTNYIIYPGLDLSDDEDLDPISSSFDVQMDSDYGLHRPRSNTAQKLDEMNKARKHAGKVKNIKCSDILPELEPNEPSNLFVKKEINQRIQMSDGKQPASRLADLLKRIPKQPVNKFINYLRFDGTAQQMDVPTKTIKVFLTILPKPHCDYPMTVCVIGSARIQEFIGLICYKCSLTNPNIQLQSVRNYALYITENDGEVEDFPPLDLREPCSKFSFNYLALVERKASDVRTDTRTMSLTSEIELVKDAVLKKKAESITSLLQSEQLARMQEHLAKMEAPSYRSYRLQILNKGIFKVNVQLGISGEKFEIDPVQQKNKKFWSRQKPLNFSMDTVGWCGLTDLKSSRAILRIMYSCYIQEQYEQEQQQQQLRKLQQMQQKQIQQEQQEQEQQQQQQQQQKHQQTHHIEKILQTTLSSSPKIQSAASSFKHFDFETDPVMAKEIVNKINHIIEVRSSAARREYLVIRERKRSNAIISSISVNGNGSGVSRSGVIGGSSASGGGNNNSSIISGGFGNTSSKLKKMFSFK